MPEAGEPAVLQDIKAALQASDLPRATTLAREALAAADRSLAIDPRHPINREGFGHWRRYREQMAPVLPLLRPWVGRFEYEPD